MNRIGIIGHRGWVAGHVLKALVVSGAPLKVIHRPGSDTSGLPAHIRTVEVSLDNEDALVHALQDVDIVISLVGQAGFADQLKLVPALARASVKLFVPSDLFAPCSPEAARAFPGLRAKLEIQERLAAAGVPSASVWVGAFTESALATSILGVDVKGNRLVLIDGAENERLNLCSASYVGAAYAALFAATLPAQLVGRRIWLSELAPSGAELFAALAAWHGAPPRVARSTHATLAAVLASEQRTLGTLYLRMWATGVLAPGAGADVFDVPEYRKATLPELVGGGLGAYRWAGTPWETIAALVEDQSAGSELSSASPHV